MLQGIRVLHAGALQDLVHAAARIQPLHQHGVAQHLRPHARGLGQVVALGGLLQGLGHQVQQGVVGQLRRLARAKQGALPLHGVVAGACLQPSAECAVQVGRHRQAARLAVALPHHIDGLDHARRAVAPAQVANFQQAHFLGRQAQLHEQHQHGAVAAADQVVRGGQLALQRAPHARRQDGALGVFAGWHVLGGDALGRIAADPALQQGMVVHAVQHAPVTAACDVAGLGLLGALRAVVDEVQHLHGAGVGPGQLVPRRVAGQKAQPRLPDEAVGLGRLGAQGRPGVLAAVQQPVVKHVLAAQGRQRRGRWGRGNQVGHSGQANRRRAAGGRPAARATQGFSLICAALAGVGGGLAGSGCRSAQARSTSSAAVPTGTRVQLQPSCSDWMP